MLKKILSKQLNFKETPYCGKDKFDTPVWQLWCVFFAYSTMSALLVQFFLLPYLFPIYNSGNGLFTIFPDGQTIHALASELAWKIKMNGWAFWRLRSSGEGIIGLTAAIYALTLPQPWVIIPLNAALHSTAGIILLRVIQIFTPNWHLAIWSVFPFILFPSAMSWYAQIHKDGYSIAGFYLFLYGYIVLVNFHSKQNRRWSIIKAVIFIYTGIALSWVVRPYLLQMFQGIGVIFGVILSIGSLLDLKFKKKSLKIATMELLVFWIIIFSIVPLNFYGKEYLKIPTIEKRQNSETIPTQPKKTSGVVWEETSGIPFFLENKLYALSQDRNNFATIYPNDHSNIDRNIRFHSFLEIIAYFPRAAEISFLAPFPNEWLKKRNSSIPWKFHFIIFFEMLVIYGALFFIPFTLWNWANRMEIWMVFIAGSTMLLLYGLTVTNIGAIYRMRYGYIMILVSIGIMGSINFWKNKRAFCEQSNELI